MSARPALRVLDGDGQVHEITTAEDENQALRSALTRAENVIRGLKAQLAAERQKARRTHPIDDAFEDWQTKLVAAGHKGKARCKLSDDRIDGINSMFEAGYTLADFELVNTGIAAAQYVVYGKRRDRGSRNDLEVDIAYVCEKARRFEEAARIGHLVEKARAEQAQQVESGANEIGPATVERPGPRHQETRS